MTTMTLETWSEALDRVRAVAARQVRSAFVDNEWQQPASAPAMDIFDPSTGGVIGQYVPASAEVVADAIARAGRAQREWARLSIEQRAQYVMRIADEVDRDQAVIAAADCLNAGLPKVGAIKDIERTANVLRQWASLAQTFRDEVINRTSSMHFTRRTPFGVVARIVAFNHPFLYSLKGTAAALLAGNTIVLKPADQTPVSMYFLADIVQRVLPPGVFNIVLGDKGTGEAMTSHDDIRRIAFTGSFGVGRAILQSATRDRIRQVSLELGGKNSMIVFPDVDVDKAAKNVIHGMNLRSNSGQSCASTSRVLVHQDIHDDFVAALNANLAQVTVGRAYEADTDMGPMVSQASAARIANYIEQAPSDGARRVDASSGNVAAALAPGFFVEPALFVDVPVASRIFTDEIFGPVIALRTWTKAEEAIAIANDTSYGLTCSIWTNDIRNAMTTADAVEAGYVWVNDSTTHTFGMPWGGWKDSGLGREECMEELVSYWQTKAVHLNY